MATIVNGRFEHLSVLPFVIEKAAVRKAEGRPRMTIQGWASTEDVDVSGEVVHVGAFDAHLADFMRNPQMVWMHEWGDSMGLWTSIRGIEGKGYWVEGYMVHLGGEQDDRRFAMVEEGLVRSLSVGFNGSYTHEYGYWEAPGVPEEEQVRVPHASVLGDCGSRNIWHWTQNCRLLEVSLCTIPANPAASIEVAKGAGMQPVVTIQRGATRFTDLPIAENENRAFDGNEARKRVAEWAGGPDKDAIDWQRYRRAFAWYDETRPDLFGSYKLIFADVIDGEVRAVWRGVAAAMAVLFGARGGVDIPREDYQAVYNHLARYYKKFGKEPPEPNFSKAVWHANEDEIIEECRAYEDMQRLGNAATSLANISRHWTKEGRAPSARIVSTAASAIAAAAHIVKASEVLSAANRSDLQQAVELINGVLRRDDEAKARRNNPPGTSEETPVIRLRL